MDLVSERRSVARVSEFLDSFMGFSAARQGRDSAGAWAAQQRMARLTHPVQHALNRVGCGYIVLLDSPASGGRRYPTELTTVAIHSDLADNYNVAPKTLILQLQTAIGELERRVERAERERYNPLWWLAQALSLMVRAPFYLLGAAGLDQEAAEASVGGTLYRRAATFAISAIGLVASLEQLGWLGPLKSWASARGIPLPLP
jgi:hypothetical protein